MPMTVSNSEKIRGKEENRAKKSSIDHLNSVSCESLQGILFGGAITVIKHVKN
jgi:hypothetical protein